MSITLIKLLFPAVIISPIVAYTSGEGARGALPPSSLGRNH